MFRTPVKCDLGEEHTKVLAAGSATVTKSSGPPRPNVCKSIGEWESGASNAGVSPSLQNTSPLAKVLNPSSPRPVVGRRMSVETAENALTNQRRKTYDRLAEARACVGTAKLHLSNSRNLKTMIKIGVNKAIDRLYQLVKEANADKGSCADSRPGLAEKISEERRDGGTCVPQESSLAQSDGILVEHMEMLKTSMAQMRTLNEALERTTFGGHDNVQVDSIDKLLGEVQELRQATEETGRKVSCLQETVPSYAEVLARPHCTISPTKLRPKHSIIVSSGNEMDTSDVVLGKVRDALEARTTGLQVTRVQKVKNQKVILSCGSKAELLKVTERITTKDKGLNVEEAKNKDPLVMIRNLLTFNKDCDIVSSLRSQNKTVLGDLRDDDFRATVKYRRRARNPHENHVVLQVSPKLWQRLTEAGKVHIDLQYAAVHDQSPLVQCTRCLGYGHGRRLCTEPADLCSYCAGPHLRADCPAQAAGGSATCRNCRLVKYPDVNHNAFDGECPVRKRWDAIARSSVAYC